MSKVHSIIQGVFGHFQNLNLLVLIDDLRREPSLVTPGQMTSTCAPWPTACRSVNWSVISVTWDRPPTWDALATMPRDTWGPIRQVFTALWSFGTRTRFPPPGCCGNSN